MYYHKIPNHLETEDTFILGLTMRQCVIIFVGACTSYTLFNNVFNAIADITLALWLGLVGASLVFMLCLAFALIKIHKRGLDEWGFVFLVYLTQPKLFLWRFNKPDAFELLDYYSLDKVDELPIQKEEENAW